jgi:hypothetical protein
VAAGVARVAEHRHAVGVVGDPPLLARRAAYPQVLMKP